MKNDIFIKLSPKSIQQLLLQKDIETQEKIKELYINLFFNDIAKFSGNKIELDNEEDKKNTITFPDNIFKDNESYGNIWKFLMDRSKYKILPIKGELVKIPILKVNNKDISDFLFTPNVNYEKFITYNKKTDILNISDIYKKFTVLHNYAYDQTIDKFNPDFNSSIFSSLFNKIFKKLPDNGLSSNRDLQDYYLLNLNQSINLPNNEILFLIWSLSGNYNKINSQSFEIFSFDFIERSIPIIDDLYEDYTRNYYDNIYENISVLNRSSSFLPDTDADKDTILSNLNKLSNAFDDVSDFRFALYKKISNGNVLYSILETMYNDKNINKEIKNIKTVNDINYIEFLYLLSVFFKDETKVSNISLKLWDLYNDANTFSTFYYNFVSNTKNHDYSKYFTVNI